MKYKYDCHCHVMEGSFDSKVKIEECINKLIEKGFNGCLITDHDSYDGYDFFFNNLKDKYKSFNVIKAIEYYSYNGGHIIVVMPKNFDTSLLTIRVLHVEELIDYVHKNKGIIGAAHPCSEPYLSIFNTRKLRNNYDLCKNLDFIETFNAGEKQEENLCANFLAKKYNLTMLGGSDSHNLETTGSGYTLFEEEIRNEDDLIAYINNKKKTTVDGNYYVNEDRKKYDKYGKLFYYLMDLNNKYLAHKTRKKRVK